MHRFNVATFVYVLIVGLVATTISLFIFGLPKDEAKVRSSVPAKSVAFESEQVEIDENEAFAETSLLETDAVEEEAEAATDALALETAVVDSFFAEETLDAEPSTESVAIEADAESAPEANAAYLDSIFVDEAIETDAEVASEAETVAVAEVAPDAETVAVAEVAPEAETVDLDSLFADEAIETDAEVASDAETVAVAEVAPEAETVDLDSLFADEAIERDAEVASEAETVAVEEVASETETVDFDSLFADEAIETDAEVASETETVAVEEVAPEAETVDLDSLFADEAIETDAEVASEAETVAVEEVAPEAETVDLDSLFAVEAINLDSLYVDDAAETDEADADETFKAQPVESAVVDPIFAEEAVESEPVVAEEAVESAPVVAEEAVESAPVVADAAVETEAFAKSGTVETVAPNAAASVRENELWILGQTGNGFYLYRLQNGAWIAKNVDDFYADAAEFATVVYAHGYQTDMTDATRDAAAFKTVLDAARRKVGSERAFRLVVWKWNSERDAARLRIDAQSKASLADWSGKALGRFLAGLDANADIALVGFSFGARVVGSALETLAKSGEQAVALSGEFDENADFAFAVSGNLIADAAEPASTDANAESSEGRKIALVLVAAACDLGSFEARGVYGRGATLPTDVLNVYNPYDFALKYYRHVSETRSDAQGVAPLRSGVFPNATGRTFNINSSPALGKRHAFVDAIGTVPTQTIGALAL